MSRRKTFIFVLLVTALVWSIPGMTYAHEPCDIYFPSIIGSVDTPDLALGVAISDLYAYVADRYSGLQIIDITNPAAPTIVGSIDTPGYAWDVTISSSYAYVADYPSGLQVVDITNPAAPTIVGFVDTPGNALAVAVSGSYAYIADVYSVQIIDITDPEAPVIVSAIDTPDGYGVAICESYAYVADQSFGLKIIELCPSGGLTQINLASPPSGSVLASPPTFTWSADGGANNAYAVDVALSPKGPIYSTYETLHQMIYVESWAMPLNIWNMLPPNKQLYWRVRGADHLDDPPLNIIISDDVWTFKKQ